jgi:hypothetical protein
VDVLGILNSDPGIFRGVLMNFSLNCRPLDFFNEFFGGLQREKFMVDG